MGIDYGAVTWLALASAGPVGVLVGLAARAQAGRPWLWVGVVAVAAVYLAVAWRLRASFGRFLRRAESERA